MSFSQLSRMRRDGLWWSALDGSKKYNYVIGYSKGVSIGSKIVIDKFIEGSKCHRKATVSFDSLEKKLVRIDVNSLIDGIDSLYRTDSLNSGIMTFHSYWIVVNRLTGTPKEENDQMYYYYRREDCEKFKSLQELKDYRLSY
jgi:acyl-ACP thioesterase